MVESPDNPSPSTNYQRHWLDHAAVWAAGAAALAAAAAAAVGAWQGWIANQGLAEAQKANEIAIRPYVKIIFRPETFIVQKSGEGDSRNIKFEVGNTGKLPGLVTLISTLGWQGRGHNRQPEMEGRFMAGKVFVFPDQHDIELESTGLSITEGQITDWLAHPDEGKVYATIKATYGNAWETEVCTIFPIRVENGAIRLSNSTRPCEEDGGGPYNYAK